MSPLAELLVSELGLGTANPSTKRGRRRPRRIEAGGSTSLQLDAGTARRIVAKRRFDDCCKF